MEKGIVGLAIQMWKPHTIEELTEEWLEICWRLVRNGQKNRDV